MRNGVPILNIIFNEFLNSLENFLQKYFYFR